MHIGRSIKKWKKSILIPLNSKTNYTLISLSYILGMKLESVNILRKAKRTVFCETCECEVVLGRKNFEHQYHELLCFLVILTLGVGFIIYYLLKYNKKPNTCPNCESVFDLKNLPSEATI